MKKKLSFNIVDLFAGCGGLGEGFRQAGFDVVADVEMDQNACETLRTRHLYYSLKNIKRGIGLYNRYIQGKISKEEIYEKYPDIRESIEKKVLNVKMDDNSVDSVIKDILKSLMHHKSNKINVIVGGPPCQPYSLIGRARDPNHMKGDKRHFLYKHYLKILEELEPDFFVYENVPGLFSATTTGERVFEKLIKDFSNLKVPYIVTPPLGAVSSNPNEYMLLSWNYGVPQSRRRLILIGFRESLLRKYPDINEVFRKIQSIAVKNLIAHKNKKRPLPLVKDAISDLPFIQPGEGEDKWYGKYNSNRNHLTSYQKYIRKDSIGISNHRARTHMKSDLERYSYFIKHWQKKNKKADLRTLMEERPDLRPEHNIINTFIDRFKVQWWDKPSSTIMAHISKDGHYYIHPDLKQCRSFTVREAARCQSFPDNFYFEGPRTEQFRQVGNAVPPRMANAIAKEIKNILDLIYNE